MFGMRLTTSCCRGLSDLAEMQQIVFVSTIILVSLSVRAGIAVIIFASGGAYGLVAVWCLRDLQ